MQSAFKNIAVSCQPIFFPRRWYPVWLKNYDAIDSRGFDMISCGNLDASYWLLAISRALFSVELQAFGMFESSNHSIYSHHKFNLQYRPLHWKFISLSWHIIFLIAYYMNGWWATTATTSIFVAAAFTDWLDGYIARKVCGLEHIDA